MSRYKKSLENLLKRIIDIESMCGRFTPPCSDTTAATLTTAPSNMALSCALSPVVDFVSFF